MCLLNLCASLTQCCWAECVCVKPDTAAHRLHEHKGVSDVEKYQQQLTQCVNICSPEFYWAVKWASVKVQVLREECADSRFSWSWSHYYTAWTLQDRKRTCKSRKTTLFKYWQIKCTSVFKVKVSWYSILELINWHGANCNFLMYCLLNESVLMHLIFLMISLSKIRFKKQQILTV